MTLLQSLKGISTYPIPSATLQSIAEGCGFTGEEEANPENLNTPEAKRAIAKVYIFLFTAPNVSQNGISFSFSAEERKAFRKIAKAILDEIGDDPSALGLGEKYGYKGEHL